MSLQRYNQIRIAIAIILAIAIGQSIAARNYMLPIALIPVASLILLYVRGRLKGVIADERDRVIAGKSALIAMHIYAWFAVAAAFVFFALGETNATFEMAANLLAFSTCALLLVYSMVFYFLAKTK